MLLRLDFYHKYFRSSAILFLTLAVPTFFASSSMATSLFRHDKALIKESNLYKPNLDNVLSSAPRVSKSTLNLVKQYEGFRSAAYIDTNGLPVVGYGQSKIYGKRVTMGQSISPAKAEAALEKELYQIQLLVLSHVKVPLTPNQLGALTSLVYNTGSRLLVRSTLIQKLNSGDYTGAAREFPRWNKAHIRGKLVPLAGLTKRRLAEQKLFFTP